jgi:mycoredoxin
MSGKSIIVYGTSWCPQTAQAKKVLADCGVQFIWCDIEKDPVGCAYVEKVNQGNRTVPTIVFPDGVVLIEPSSIELERKARTMK